MAQYQYPRQQQPARVADADTPPSSAAAVLRPAQQHNHHHHQPPPPSSASSTSLSPSASFALGHSAAADTWSLILPAPASRVPSYSSSRPPQHAVRGGLQPYAQRAPHHPQPLPSASDPNWSPPSPQQVLGLPAHDGRGVFPPPAPGYDARPLLHYRTASDLTQTSSLDSISLDGFSSLGSTATTTDAEHEHSSEAWVSSSSAADASELEVSPSFSPFSVISTGQALPLPPLGLGSLASLRAPYGQPPLPRWTSSTDSSPSQSSSYNPTRNDAAVPLSRVPTVVGVSLMGSDNLLGLTSSSPIAGPSTAGFKSTFRAARRGDTHTPPARLVKLEDPPPPFFPRGWATDVLDEGLYERLVGVSPSAAGGRSARLSLAAEVDVAPTPVSTSLFRAFWPACAASSTPPDEPASAAGPPSALWQTLGFLRALLALDEPTVLLLFAPPSTSSAPAPTAAVKRRGEERRPRLERKDSAEPGTKSRRALLLLAVSRVAGQVA